MPTDDTGNPTRMIWTLWERVDGKLVLINGSDPNALGGLVVSPEEAPHIAAALAAHCDDNDQRDFVRSAWGWLDPPDDDDEEGSDAAD